MTIYELDETSYSKLSQNTRAWLKQGLKEIGKPLPKGIVFPNEPHSDLSREEFISMIREHGYEDATHLCQWANHIFSTPKNNPSMTELLSIAMEELDQELFIAMLEIGKKHSIHQHAQNRTIFRTATNDYADKEMRRLMGGGATLLEIAGGKGKTAIVKAMLNSGFSPSKGGQKPSSAEMVFRCRELHNISETLIDIITADPEALTDMYKSGQNNPDVHGLCCATVMAKADSNIGKAIAAFLKNNPSVVENLLRKSSQNVKSQIESLALKRDETEFFTANRKTV